MGHPVNGIEYVLSNWEYLRGQFPYYVFFLFTDKNKSFTHFFREHFYQLDQISGHGCMFFAIAPPPPDWQDVAQEREYWKHYLADPEANIGYDEQAVFQAARYFEIPQEHLPAAVVFQDIRKSDAISVRLGELSPDEWSGFLTNLFSVFKMAQSHSLQDLYSPALQNLMSYLPGRQKSDEWLHEFAMRFISPARPNPEPFQRQGQFYLFNNEKLSRRPIAYRTIYPQRIETILRSMQNEISRLGGEIAALREEQREGFRQVNVHLERIQVVLEETVHRIEEFRGPFLDRWFSLEDTAGSSEELISIRQDLHQEFDEFLLQQSDYLARRLDKFLVTLPECLHPVENLLEQSTKACLLSSELLWENLREMDMPWLDFAVCGIGLWKAVEIELNRTFIDALRVHRKICVPGSFSINQVVTVRGYTEEKGTFGPKQSDIDISEMDIHSKTGPERTGKFRGVELGKIRGLLANNTRNSFAAIVGLSHLPRTAADLNDNEFLMKISDEVSIVANKYRNSHAHVRPMSCSTCDEFRQYIFNSSHPYNPLFATLHCKQVFLKDNVI